jgi:hypothetical protein
MRRIRKIITYACTRCYQLFPNAKDAKAHAATHPALPSPAGAGRKRRGPTQTGRILEAIQGGATDAGAISKKTKIPLGRVHSLLSYHRRRGNVKGFSGKLKAA